MLIRVLRLCLGRIDTLFSPCEKYPGSRRLAAVPARTPHETLLGSPVVWLPAQSVAHTALKKNQPINYLGKMPSFYDAASGGHAIKSVAWLLLRSLCHQHAIIHNEVDDFR